MRYGAPFSSRVAITERANGLPGTVWMVNSVISFPSIVGERCEKAEDVAPTGTDEAGDARRVLAVALQIAVLERHPRATFREGGEGELHLRQHRGVVAEALVELPAEHQPLRRVPDQHLAPRRLRPLLVAFVPAAALVG